jgi:hypothetical protein
MGVGGVRRIEVTERETPALGFGISQSGRVLRDLVHLGFNQDLAGRQVFDGILPVVAGSRRTCVNWQFAQAGRYSRQHEDHSYGDDQFPFSYPTLTDPISGRSSGILQRARDAGVCPKVLHLDTESDFWQARSSLIATDTNGDIAMPDEVRVYTVSGVPHAPFRPLTKPVMQLLIRFARTRTERDAAGDLRHSLEERYGSRENYIARVEAAAAALVADRLLLWADAAAYSIQRGNAIGSEGVGRGGRVLI